MAITFGSCVADSDSTLLIALLMTHYRHLPVAPLLPLQRLTAAVMPFTGKWKAALDLAVHLEHAVRAMALDERVAAGCAEQREAQRGGAMDSATPGNRECCASLWSVQPAQLNPFLSTSHRGPT